MLPEHRALSSYIDGIAAASPRGELVVQGYLWTVVVEKMKVEACQDAVFTSAQTPEGHADITISLYAEQAEVHCIPFLGRDHVVQPRPCG